MTMMDLSQSQASSDTDLYSSPQSRYLPPARDRYKDVKASYVYRAIARNGGEGTVDEQFEAVARPCFYRRPQQINILPRRAPGELRLRLTGNSVIRGYPKRRTRGAWSDDAREGRDLAQSRIPLPSDRPSLPRHASLDRQDAFRDESTSKRRALASSPAQSQPPAPVPVDEDEDVAQLYQLGLLYDNEYSRGALFNLDTIVHDEPTYTLRVSKKARKTPRTDFSADDHEDHVSVSPYRLPLELSLSELHRDDAVAKFLISPPASETSDEDEETREAVRRRTFASVYRTVVAQMRTRTAAPSPLAQVAEVSEDAEDGTRDDENPQTTQPFAYALDPPTTQLPDFETDYASDNASVMTEDADLVILPLDGDYFDADTDVEMTSPDPKFPDADPAASWIMLGDDSKQVRI